MAINLIIDLDTLPERDDYNSISLDSSKKYNNLDELVVEFEDNMHEQVEEFARFIDSHSLTPFGIAETSESNISIDVELLSEYFDKIKINIFGNDDFIENKSELEYETLMNTLQMMLEDYHDTYYQEALMLGFYDKDNK